MIRKEQLRLYAITDTSWLNGASLIDVVENVLKNGATFLQLREKNASHDEIVEKAKAIKPIARKYGVPFVIDDDVQAALEADADGVHIGQSDTDYMTARSILGDNKIIGMTAKTVEQAKEAERLGADYIGTGAVFGSSTKKDAVYMPRERLIEVAGSVNIPVVANRAEPAGCSVSYEHRSGSGSALGSGLPRAGLAHCHPRIRRRDL